MKQFIIVVMVSSFIFLMGCLSTTFLESTGHTWTSAELISYWDGFNSISQLFDDLNKKGYRYGNELTDTVLTDVAATATQTMTRGWGNCYAWTQYLMEFAEYKKSKRIKVAKSLKEVYLRNDLKWHYIIIADESDAEDILLIKELSNLDYGYRQSEESVFDRWFNEGYKYQKIVRTFNF